MVSVRASLGVFALRGVIFPTTISRIDGKTSPISAEAINTAFESVGRKR